MSFNFCSQILVLHQLISHNWYFSVFSSPCCLEMDLCSEEKFFFGHPLRWKDQDSYNLCWEIPCNLFLSHGSEQAVEHYKEETKTTDTLKFSSLQKLPNIHAKYIYLAIKEDKLLLDNKEILSVRHKMNSEFAKYKYKTG